MESDLVENLKAYLVGSNHPTSQERVIISKRNFGIYIAPCRFASADPRRFLLAQGNSCYSRHCLCSSPKTISLTGLCGFFALLHVFVDRLMDDEHIGNNPRNPLGKHEFRRVIAREACSRKTSVPRGKVSCSESRMLPALEVREELELAPGRP